MNTTKLSSKIMAVILAFVLTAGVASISPHTAYAATGTMNIGSTNGIDMNDGPKSGMGWTWDEATNTLTLTDASIGTPYAIGIDCAETDTINLVLVGDSSVESYDYQTAVSCNGSLHISGGGSLTAKGKESIFVQGSLTIAGGTVHAETIGPAASDGIFAQNGVTITGGDVTAIGEHIGISTGGASGNANVVINGGVVNAIGAFYGIYATNSVTIGSAVVTAEGSIYGIRAYNDVKINSGTVTVTGGLYSNYGEVIINGGTVTNDSAQYYPVTYDLNSGGGVAPSDTYKAAGATFPAAAITGMTATAGWQFKEWNTQADGGGTAYAPGTNVTMPNAALTLYAIWEPISYTVTWNAEGGLPAPAQTSVNHGGNITEPAAMSKTGNTFGGWYTNAGLTTAAVFPITGVTVTTATELWAKWTYNGESINGGGYTPSNPTGSFSGGNSTYTQGTSTGIIYTVNKDFAQFDNVRVDNNTLTRNTQYTVENSSTKITLLPAYLDTLAAGTHTLRVGFKDNTSSTVQFTVTAAAVPSIPFNDVAADAWYYDAVKYVYEKGLMVGTADDVFSPDATLTRSMIVTILHRHAGEPGVEGLENPFNDVADGEWYADAVKWAAANGIVMGYGNGKFGPDDPVTNEQLAALIFRTQQAENKIPMDILMDYEWPDWDNISDWAKSVVTKLTMQGIFADIPGNNLNPRDPSNRAEIASMLYKWLTAIEE